MFNTLARQIAPALMLAGLFALAGCSSTPKPPPSFQARIAKAHGYGWWSDKRGSLAADIHVTFLADNPDNNRFFDARFTYDIQTGKTRMQLADDTIIVFDGQRAWVSPAASKVRKAKFIATTWPYFVAAPFRFEDGATAVGPVEMRELAGQQCPSAKVTFTGGPGHSGEDWCIAYADPKTYRLLGLAYSLKGGQGVEGFSESALAITYYGYKETDGVLLAHEWRIWKWNKEVGIYDKPVAEGRIYNVEYIYPHKSKFDKPADAREAE